MPAVAEAHVFHGVSPGTPTNITSTTIRFKKADNDTADANNPLTIPAAGSNYSWRKAFKLRCPTTGPDNRLESLRFFSEVQNMGTGRNLLIQQPGTYTQASSADETAETAGSLPAGRFADFYTSFVPLVVNGGQVFSAAQTGSGTQDFVVLQARVETTAAVGNVAANKGLVYRFDET